MRSLAQLLGIRPEPGYAAKVKIKTISDVLDEVGATKVSDTPDLIYRSLMNMLITRPLGTDSIGNDVLRTKVGTAFGHLRCAEALLKEWREADRDEPVPSTPFR